jgi:poly-gamma-glutamate capsule biosynthesis protein CapA/YwtB (metallophosphatase superfamily)
MIPSVLKSAALVRQSMVFLRAAHLRGSKFCWLLTISLLGSAAVAQQNPPAISPADPEIKDLSKFDPKRPLARELDTNVPDGFTVVAVGDCIISRPLMQYAPRDEGFRKVVEILKRADVSYGNMETSILDMRHFGGYPYPGPDDVSLVAAPEVAQDLAQMGFDLVSRANNHALDWGVEGMRETSRWLESAGIAYAGVGENLGLASGAGYYEGPKARVALVSMAATYRPGSEALPPSGAAPGRPGVNALSLDKDVVLTPDQMAEALRFRDMLYPAEKNSPKQAELNLLGNTLVEGTTFGFHYKMDPVDLAVILRGVRQGKQHSDFLITSIHSHQPASSTKSAPQTDFEDTPADFVQELAHKAIDTGSDAFVVTGIHHLGPIEIYKGRPIFYGMGDFFWGDIQEPISADVYQQNRIALGEALVHPERATHADLNNVTNALGFAGQPPFDAVIAESHFEHNQLAEIRLYPVDLGYGKKLTESGTPRLAAPEQARRILQHLEEISARHGTKIIIDGSVGVIRP